ncbi:MAG: S-methyl-5-thioribose-1-phosphate isomerase, partial [Chloroflexota bacterium]
MRTVYWETNSVKLIDQRKLPWEYKIESYSDYRDLAQAIADMVVRGAPAIGATAGFGMALAARQFASPTVVALQQELQRAADVLLSSRPTAVNLKWAVTQQLELALSPAWSDVTSLQQALLVNAQRIADEDVSINQRMGAHGATLVNDGDTIIHHCNTGSLATVDYGTALGVIRAAHEQGKKIHVLVDETRPRLQGARLTAWELDRIGVSYDLIADNAAGHFMRTGQVNLVLVGADRIAANGDVANKIGTYKLAV